MKKYLLTAFLAALVTACGPQPGTLSYSVEFDTESQDLMAALTLALRGVTERHLASLEANLIDYDVRHTQETGETTVEIEIDDSDAIDALNTRLTDSLQFEIRYLADDQQEDDIAVEGTGNFRATGVDGEDVDWVFGDAMDGPLNQGKLTIGFTEAGAKEMKTLFETRNEGTIGIFVRGQVVAILKINDEEFTQVIEIPGVPSADLAKVVADDMNVGIHMTLTRQ